jgi:hypothetical protein
MSNQSNSQIMIGQTNIKGTHADSTHNMFDGSTVEMS